MSTIYRVYHNITGRFREEFFATFDAAKKSIQTIRGVDYLDNEYFIGGMSCKISQNDDSFYMSANSIYDDNVQYYCGIESFELPFEIKDDGFWTLYLVTGDASIMIYNDEPGSKIIGHYPSKKAGRKFATRTKWLKRFPRAWVRQGEEAHKKDGVRGYGMDYLNLCKIRVYA